MTTPTELEYFEVTGFFYDVQQPLAGDVGSEPEFSVISGFVTFTPRLPATIYVDDLDVGGTAHDTALAVTPIVGQIMGGQLCSIDIPDTPGVQLLSNTANLGLAALGISELVYDVAFSSIVYAHKGFTLGNFAFVAPTDGTAVNITDPALTRLPPLSGALTSFTVESVFGPIRLVAGVPTDADFSTAPRDGTLAFDTNNTLLYVRILGAWTPQQQTIIDAGGTSVTIVTASETIAAHDDDTTIPTSAAVAAAIAAERLTFNVDDYGADPTGATSSNTAITEARADMGPIDILEFGCGTYDYTVPIATMGPYQGVKAQGRAHTLLKFHGTGDAISARDSRAFVSFPAFLPGGSGGPGWGGEFTGFTIDGTGSGTGSTGLHIGDLTGVKIDAAVINFSGTSQIGVWMHNQTTWSEKLDADVHVHNCTKAVVFDGGTFDYGTKIQIALALYPNQDGVTLRNNVSMMGASLKIVGGCVNDTTNTGTVLVVGKDNSDTAHFRGHLDVDVESGTETTGVVHKTIAIGNVASIVGYGSLHFFRRPSPIIQWTNGSGIARMAFTGHIDVDDTFGRSLALQGSRTVGLLTGARGYLDPSGDLYLDGGNWYAAQLTSGARTLNMIYAASTLGYPQAGSFDLFLQQPASGSSTVTWPAGFTWLDGTAPTLSTTPNAVDHIHIATADFTTFYAKHVNAAVSTLALRFSSINDTNGNAGLDIAATASAVNRLRANNAAAGTAPGLEAIGTDPNISIALAPKGTGGLYSWVNSQGALYYTVDGSSADVSIVLQPKGAGRVYAGSNQVVALAGVQVVAAPTGVAATDTAAIQAAHDALPAAGGIIMPHAGLYALTNPGPTFTKKVHLIGVGPADGNLAGGTQFWSNSTSAVGLTINPTASFPTGIGSTIENISFINNDTLTPASGVGLRIVDATGLMILRCSFFNFYDNISIEGGYAWTIQGSFVNNCGRYGLRVRNLIDPDSGDGTVIGSWFIPLGGATTPTAAIRWESDAGLRIINSKFNQGSKKWGIAIDAAFQGDVKNTGGLYIWNNSIENISGTGIKLSRIAGSFVAYLTSIQNNEFQTMTTGIELGAGWSNVIVSGNVGKTVTTPVTNTGALIVTQANNQWNGAVTDAVGQNLIPTTNNTYDLGDSSHFFNNANLNTVNAYLMKLNQNSSPFTGLTTLQYLSPTSGNTITFPDASGLGTIEQLITLTSPYTLTSQTAAQKLFNATTNGAVTLPVGTYFFECLFDLSSMSASSGSFGFAFGGTATIASQKWLAIANKAVLATPASSVESVNTAANTTLITANTTTTGWAKITGKVRTSGAGTLIPQVSLGVAAAAIVSADSYFRIWAVGTNSVTNVGAWT